MAATSYQPCDAIRQMDSVSQLCCSGAERNATCPDVGGGGLAMGGAEQREAGRGLGQDRGARTLAILAKYGEYSASLLVDPAKPAMDGAWP